jgi:chromosome segregation ATPase
VTPRVSGVAAWSIRAAMFARMIARAYPDGRIPGPVSQALDELWKLSATAARVEGSMGADASSLEAHERRTREFRGQLGRRIEELARETSHGRRKIGELNERRELLARSVDEAKTLVNSLRGRITALEVAGEMGAPLREAYQALGAAEARATAREDELEELKSQIQATETQCAGLEQQSRSYRDQLDKNADVMDAEASAMRRRVAERAEESARHERGLSDATQVLVDALANRPECDEILREMQELVGLPSTTRPPVAVSGRPLQSGPR